MKNLFNEADKLELIERINNLTPGTTPEWGKMNASKMLEHCTISIKLALSEIKPELNEEHLKLGGMVKDRVFQSDVFSRELSTSKEFIIDNDGNFDKNKSVFLDYIKRFAESNPNLELKGIHPYFGELTMNEWARLIWIHTNHHLIQFGS
jgi:hypothetical protein